MSKQRPAGEKPAAKPAGDLESYLLAAGIARRDRDRYLAQLTAAGKQACLAAAQAGGPRALGDALAKHLSAEGGDGD